MCFDLVSKTTLDSLLDKNEMEVSVTSKVWEPVRAYQKRLVTNMAKDPCKLKTLPKTIFPLSLTVSPLQ